MEGQRAAGEGTGPTWVRGQASSRSSRCTFTVASGKVAHCPLGPRFRGGNGSPAPVRASSVPQSEPHCGAYRRAGPGDVRYLGQTRRRRQPAAWCPECEVSEGQLCREGQGTRDRPGDWRVVG